MDLVRNKCGLKDVPIVFVDTGLEFPEIRKMGKKYANVILKPEMNFKEILKKCGYPVISKEVASTVEGSNKFLREREIEYNKYSYYYRRIAGLGEYSKNLKKNVGDISERQQKHNSIDPP